MSQLIDHRAEFSRWWSKEMRAVKFPSQGTVFDFFIDPETKKFTPWSERMLPFELEPEAPLQVRGPTGSQVSSMGAPRETQTHLENMDTT